VGLDREVVDDERDRIASDSGCSRDGCAASGAALDQQVEINRARLVTAEAMPIRVAKPVQTKELTAATIPPVQERTVVGTVIGCMRHTRPVGDTKNIGPKMTKP
jgi:hypothetical protein